MPTITRLYSFEAAHYLPKVHEKHRCRRMHGHNYEFELTVFSPSLDEHGFVIDFWDLDEIVSGNVLRYVDHTLLNDVLENPTAEIIATWIMRQMTGAFKHDDIKVTSVRVWETKTCSAIVMGE